MLPQTNALITQITSPTKSGDWGNLPGPHNIRWQGMARIYTVMSAVRTTGDAGVDESIQRVAHLPAGMTVIPRSGDTIAFTRDGGEPESAVVDAVNQARAGTLQGPISLTLRAG